MAYLNTPYQNSISYHAVMHATTRQQLLNRLVYTVGAIEFHEREGNAGQVKFFRDELALIERRLKNVHP